MSLHVRLAILSVIVGAALSAAPWQPARAVPSFARQTGLGCAACHTAYPELNAFGRAFKMHGYTLGSSGGGYPPLALMLQPGFTHTAKTQGTNNPVDGFNGNNNTALSQASLFYGGRIYDKLGAFSQLTYSGTEDRLAIDNTDVRYADSGTLAGKALEYGFTLNNNPTVQDPWNTLPAWGYPFATSDFMPSPGASTLIDGGFGQQVAGVGGYVHWNDMIYAEFTGYRTLSRETLTFLGAEPNGDEIDGVAPYWRLELSHSFGNHYLSVGTFGLAANTYPGRDHSAGTDSRIDVGLDAQYQYDVAPHDIGVYLRWIHEKADWNASVPLGNASNGHDSLDDLSLTGSYLYDLTYGADVSFHTITGRADTARYGDSALNGSPDTQSMTLQLDWLPFNKNGGPSEWKWFNPKFILQYTRYFKFDGAATNYDAAGRNAGDNDTLYAMVWLPL